MTGSWKTVRVFISSTFRDMQAERDHLVRFVFPQLREELLKRRIHLTDVDLRWGVTSEQDAVDVCREVIDECRPRFMGILGGRYGWVPNGKSESITADEIHYAVLDRATENRGQAFFYFRDETATQAMVEETPGEYREPAGSLNAGKLADLKQAILEAGLLCNIYPAHWSDTQQRLIGLEAFGSRVHADLIESLKGDPELADRFAADADSKVPDEFAEEAEQMEAFIEERTERFVIGSREPLMREMLAFAVGNDTPNCFVLTGDPGSGKSALLAKFARELPSFLSTLKSQPPSLLLLLHFIGASPGSTDLRRTLRRLCHELAKAAGNTEPLPLDIKELITHFQKLLAEGSGKQRVILVFDALNQFDATDGAHWMNWLPRELPPGVRIVASVIAPAEGQPEHQTLAILRTRSDTRIVNLSALSWRDSVRIMRGYLRRFSKHLSKSQKRALLKKSGSHLPLYVLTALEELRTLGTDVQVNALSTHPVTAAELERMRIEDHDSILAAFIENELPTTPAGLFQWILETRLSRDPLLSDHPEGAPALVGKFAACLGVSRHGLSEDELAAILAPARSPDVKNDELGNVAALLRLLRPYLMRRGELLDFYHGQFREAAGAAYLDSSEKQRAMHERLGYYYWNTPLYFDPGNQSSLNERKVTCQPWHFSHANSWLQLKHTYEDLPLLEAACKLEPGAVVSNWLMIEAKSPYRMRQTYEDLIREPGQLPHSLRLYFADLFESCGHDTEALVLCEAFIDEYRQADQTLELATALAHLGQIHSRLHSQSNALAAYEESKALFLRHRETKSAYAIEIAQAPILVALQRGSEAIAMLEASAAVFDRDGDLLAHALNLLAQSEVHCDVDLDKSISLQKVREAIRLALKSSSTNCLAHCLAHYGFIAGSEGNNREAIEGYTAAEQAYRSLGDFAGLAPVLCNKAAHLAECNDSTNAFRALEEAEYLSHLLKNKNLQATCMGVRARILLDSSPVQSLTMLKRSYRVAVEMGYTELSQSVAINLDAARKRCATLAGVASAECIHPALYRLPVRECDSPQCDNAGRFTRDRIVFVGGSPKCVAGWCDACKKCVCMECAHPHRIRDDEFWALPHDDPIKDHSIRTGTIPFSPKCPVCESFLGTGDETLTILNAIGVVNQ